MALQLRETEAAYRERATLDLGVTASVVAQESTTYIDENIRQASVLSRDPEILSFDPAVQLAFIQRVLRGEPSISQVIIVDVPGTPSSIQAAGREAGTYAARSLASSTFFRRRNPTGVLACRPA